VGGYGEAGHADGTKDQHFILEVDLPPETGLEELVITSGGFHRWVTQPSERFWPIAVYQGDKAISRSHTTKVGTFSDKQSFDLYLNTGIGIGPGTVFEIQAVVSVSGTGYTLSSQCKRP
jgi:hypothetical protein